MTDLFRSGHEVDGGVVVVILLEKAEGELVVNQQVVCRDRETNSRSGTIFLKCRDTQSEEPQPEEAPKKETTSACGCLHFHINNAVLQSAQTRVEEDL